MAAALRFGFLARYRAAVSDQLKENEIVHVYFGLAPAIVRPNPKEVSSITMRSLPELLRDTGRKPGSYAVWLRYYLTHHPREVAAGIDGVLRRARRKGTRHAVSVVAAAT